MRSNLRLRGQTAAVHEPSAQRRLRPTPRGPGLEADGAAHPLLEPALCGSQSPRGSPPVCGSFFHLPGGSPPPLQELRPSVGARFPGESPPPSAGRAHLSVSARPLPHGSHPLWELTLLWEPHPPCRSPPPLCGARPGAGANPVCRSSPLCECPPPPWEPTLCRSSAPLWVPVSLWEPTPCRSPPSVGARSPLWSPPYRSPPLCGVPISPMGALPFCGSSASLWEPALVHACPSWRRGVKTKHFRSFSRATNAAAKNMMVELYWNKATEGKEPKPVCQRPVLWLRAFSQPQRTLIFTQPRRDLKQGGRSHH